MKKQINCIHDGKTHCYSYDLINAELNLCNKCEKKLRKEIIEQDKIENELNVCKCKNKDGCCKK
jgi:hypothetical protein